MKNVRVRVTTATVRPLAVTTPPSWSSDTYSYDGSGNIVAIGSDSFRYDGVMRLTSATVSGHAEEYGYDAFGNMKSKTVGGVVTQIGVQPDTNRLTSWAYDVAGNITGLSVGAQQYWYDGFNLMSKKFESGNNATELYLYTADDERIGVVLPNDKITWSIRDVEGKVLRQYQSDYANPQAPWLGSRTTSTATRRCSPPTGCRRKAAAASSTSTTSAPRAW